MSEDTGKALLISGASILVGYTLKIYSRKKWKKIYDEEPPTTNPSEEIDWKKVILWSIITGTAISTAKLATSRYLTLKLQSSES